MNLGNVSNLGALTSLRSSGGLSGLARSRTFSAPLTNSLLASGKGSTTPTFTRATTAFFKDFEGVLREVQSGEARFQGARRVRNIQTKTEDFTIDGTNWNIFNAGTGSAPTTTNNYALAPDNTMTAGRLQMTIAAGTANGDRAELIGINSSPFVVGKVYLASIWVKSNDNNNYIFQASYNGSGTSLITVTPTWTQVDWTLFTASSTNQPMRLGLRGDQGTSKTIDILIWHPQHEEVTGALVQTHSEYVSNGVLSAPYHGAGIDGVKYFNTTRLHDQNFLIRSNNFLSTWSSSGTATIALAGTGDAPEGLDSFSLTDAVGSAAYRVVQSATIATVGSTSRSFKCSFYLKAGTKNTALVMITDSGFTNRAACSISDLANRTFVHSNAGTMTGSSTMVDAGNGWSLVTVTGTFATDPSTVVYASVYMSDNTSLTNYSGSGETILVAGGSLRLNSSSVSDTFVTTTTTPLTTYSGTDATIPATINYGFQMEPANTNICLQSNTFATTWVATDTTPTNATYISPTGETTASRIVEGVAGTASLVQTGFTVTANTIYNVAVYAKKVSGNDFVRLRYLNGAGTDGVEAWFNLSTGVVGTLAAVGTGTVDRRDIEAMNNGWYKLMLTGTVDAASTTAQIQIMSASADNTATRVNNATYGLFGAQLEAGSGNLRICSSHIPTTTVAVTRNNGILSYPYLGNFDNTVGTAYCELTVYRISFNANNIIQTDGNIEFIMVTNFGSTARIRDGVTTVSSTGTPTSAQTPQKFATSWGTNKLSANRTGGGLATTASFDGSMNATTNIIIGQGGGVTLAANGTVRNIRMYKVQVSDTQLNALVA
jgi:hypothetical protein